MNGMAATQMSTEDKNHYKPWTSDEEPNIKDLEGWGLDGVAGAGYKPECDHCKNIVEWTEQYLYKYVPDTPYVLIRHNTEECTRDLRS